MAQLGAAMPCLADMHADRWSATAWVVALLANVALCAYLAARVCLDSPWLPPRSLAAVVLVQPGEVLCNWTYVARIQAAVDALDHEIRTLYRDHENEASPERRAPIALQIEDAEARQAGLVRVRVGCEELHAAARLSNRFEEHVRRQRRAEHASCANAPSGCP